MTYRAKVTSKGQITLPAEMRKALGIRTGDTVYFERSETGTFVIRGTEHTFKDLRGILSHDGPPLSSDEIVELVRLSREGKGADFLENRKSTKIAAE
ncbi:MAG: AbrB/MazE/SpoVT family DNA-binding domain-containing protein [Pseudomonadota bacterium]